jgi:queuine/archaeosine tRNA-ribosyltransferase
MPTACCRIDLFQSPMVEEPAGFKSSKFTVKIQTRYSFRCHLSGRNHMLSPEKALAVRSLTSQHEFQKEEKLEDA